MEADERAGRKLDGPLFVLVHGYDPDRNLWDSLEEVLLSEGSVLRLTYDAAPTSNADPQHIANGIGAAIADANVRGSRIVIVAHSIGALLARRAVLDGLRRGDNWSQDVERLVLLAGMNRGWSAGGQLPPVATIWLQLRLRIGYWLAKMLRRGELLLDLQRGAPFVSNLRLEWMQHMRDVLVPAMAGKGGRVLRVVLLLGDIDDFVHREDNEDLRTTAQGEFALLRVRGTGHADILDFHEGSQKEDERQLGEYRRKKIVHAATSDFVVVKAQSEVLPPPTDPQVTDVIFVLHGIRDIGRWSSRFEEEVSKHTLADGRGKLLFISPRYGYLGMGPFLFEGVRNKYVRWFMDEYTEALARYPNLKAENIRFFGHSNGTYLLADALHNYTSMRVGNVVLAGSVVPTAYPWSRLGGRIGAIRSYAGSHDWVVAWFPRMFELPLLSWLGNPLGGGGFHGFTDSSVENILAKGDHGAFSGREEEIITFLMEAKPQQARLGNPNAWKQSRRGWEVVMGWAPIAVLVWLLLAAGASYLALRVVGAAPAPQWPVLLIFVLLIVTVLRTV